MGQFLFAFCASNPVTRCPGRGARQPRQRPSAADAQRSTMKFCSTVAALPCIGREVLRLARIALASSVMWSNLGVVTGSQLRRVFSIQDHRLRRSRSRRWALEAVIIFKLLFGRRRCFAIPVVFYRFVHGSASDMVSQIVLANMMCRFRLCRGGHTKRQIGRWRLAVRGLPCGLCRGRVRPSLSSARFL